MRKKTANAPPRTTRQTKRALRLSKETVRTLTKDELAEADGGCLTISTPWTTLDRDPHI